MKICTNAFRTLTWSTPSLNHLWGQFLFLVQYNKEFDRQGSWREDEERGGCEWGRRPASSPTRWRETWSSRNRTNGSRCPSTRSRELPCWCCNVLEEKAGFLAETVKEGNAVLNDLGILEHDSMPVGNDLATGKSIWCALSTVSTVAWGPAKAGERGYHLLEAMVFLEHSAIQLTLWPLVAMGHQLMCL